MKDSFGREIEYLRLSVTDRCNLRCRYCMPDGIRLTPMSEILTYEEMVKVAEAAAGLGISKLKITGGEPLVRRGLSSLISLLKAVSGIEEVTLTTNGVLLCEQINELAAAGIDGINISLDTLDRERYRAITGFDCLEQVLEGLDKVIGQGIPVKINAVSADWKKFAAGTSENEDPAVFRELISLAELGRDRPVDVRFIELMPIGFGKGFPGLSHDILIPELKKYYSGIKEDKNRHGNGPAVYYTIPGFKGGLGFISAIHGRFCERCNRIRLTSKGFLKSCLCYDTGVDLKEILRGELSDGLKLKSLSGKIEEAVLSKPASHSFTEEENISEQQAMSAIGG